MLAGAARRVGRRWQARRRSPTTRPGRRTCTCSRATRALGNLELGALQPAGRAWLHRALLREGFGLAPSRGAVEGDAGGRRPRRRRAAAGARRRRRLPHRRRPRRSARAAGRAGARPRRWRSRWAGPAASACASASWSRPRSRTSWGCSRGRWRRYLGAHEGHASPTAPRSSCPTAPRAPTPRAAIGEGLARAALGVTVDGELRDLSAPLPDGGQHRDRHRPRAARRRSGWSATTPPTCWPPR